MDDYIKRDDAIETVYHIRKKPADDEWAGKWLTPLQDIPSADIRENIKGEWQITDAYPHNVYCSNCHKKFAQTHWAVWEDGSLPRNFCPNCGADMRGEA